MALINNIDNQLDATIIVLLTISFSSTCFGQIIARNMLSWLKLLMKLLLLHLVGYRYCLCQGCTVKQISLVSGQLDMAGSNINGVLTFFRNTKKAKSFTITVPEMMHFHTVLTSSDWPIRHYQICFSTIRVVQYWLHSSSVFQLK